MGSGLVDSDAVDAPGWPRIRGHVTLELRARGATTMALKGKMDKMKMSDGAEIGVYLCNRRGDGAAGSCSSGNFRRHRAHQGAVRRLCRRGHTRCLHRRSMTARRRASRPPIHRKTSRRRSRSRAPKHPFDLSIADTQVCIDDLKTARHVFISRLLLWRLGDVGSSRTLHGPQLPRQRYYGGNIGQMIDLQAEDASTILHFGEKRSRHSDGTSSTR